MHALKAVIIAKTVFSIIKGPNFALCYGARLYIIRYPVLANKLIDANMIDAMGHTKTKTINENTNNVIISI